MRISRLTIVATLAVILVGLGLAVPSLFSKDQRAAFMAGLPSWVPHWIFPSRAIVLELDLQGGSQLAIEVDRNDLATKKARALREEVRVILGRESVDLRREGGIRVVDRGVQLRISDPALRAQVMPKLRDLSQPIDDARIGTAGTSTIDVTEQPDGTIRLTYSDAGLIDVTRKAMAEGIEVVRRRIDPDGVLEPSIQLQGADRILIQVPGVQDPQAIEERLGRIANLEFRLIADSPSGDVDWLPMKNDAGSAGSGAPGPRLPDPSRAK